MQSFTRSRSSIETQHEARSVGHCGKLHAERDQESRFGDESNGALPPRNHWLKSFIHPSILVSIMSAGLVPHAPAHLTHLFS